MKNKKLIISAYILSICPLIFGSYLFIYWYINRFCFLHYVDIEIQSFFAIMSFIFFGIISLVITIYLFIKNKENRLHNIMNFLLIILTAILIMLYGTIYNDYINLATIRIKNESGIPICDVRLFGSYFEKSQMECLEDNENKIYDIQPLRKYTWKLSGNSYPFFPFTYEKIKIDFSFYGVKKIYYLPEIQENEYIELIIKKDKKITFRKTHNQYHF